LDAHDGSNQSIAITQVRSLVERLQTPVFQTAASSPDGLWSPMQQNGK